MRLQPRLGPANFALLSLYFAPVWGADAVRALMSPYSGFEDRVHAAAAIYVGGLFDLTGVTSNPSIFAKAIGGSTDYDGVIDEIAFSMSNARRERTKC